MNLIQTIKHILTDILPRQNPIAGRNIAVDRSPSGSIISCLLNPYPHASSVFVRNATGADLPLGTVLAVTGIVENPPAESDIHVEAIVFSVAIPEAGASPVSIAILMEDVPDGYDGRAAISGAAVARLSAAMPSVPGRAAFSGTGTLAPSDDGPVTIVAADNSRLTAVAIIGGNGGTASSQGKQTGAFDVKIDGENVIVYDSSDPDGDYCGYVHAGSKTIHVPKTTLALPTSRQGRIYVNVSYGNPGGWNVSVSYEDGAGNTTFSERIAEVLTSSSHSTVLLSRVLGDIRITGRWLV